MNVFAWIALCVASLLAVFPPAASAAEINHTAISHRVIKETGRKFGEGAANRVIAWSNLVIENKGKSVAEKLVLTNDFINRIPIKSDNDLWGHSHWSTPYEMLARNAGSHADHAIAKYVTLEAMGVSVDHLHITHVHSIATPDQSYMVLTYHPEPGAMPLVLDTVNGQIKPANERADLAPENSFNDNAMWLPGTQDDGRDNMSEEAAKHIELWNEMNIRMDNELLSTEDPSSMW
jgi:predicted transglutaminase-like cysteine proteinase